MSGQNSVIIYLFYDQKFNLNQHVDIFTQVSIIIVLVQQPRHYIGTIIKNFK